MLPKCWQSVRRWQVPHLHDGHKKLIQSVLDEGKDVCIAIRDTEISADNPYTVLERMGMIENAFPQVKVITIPDINEIVFGRKVGYGIRELKLDDATESISGTQIRGQQ
jgi:adenylylsulfate kinase